jgi:hypothetical protein
VEEVWIDGKGAEMERQCDIELSGRTDGSKIGMDGRATTERESPPHSFFTKPPQLFPSSFFS